MKVNRTRDQWAAVRPDAFLAGSLQQARNVIEMMQQDIAVLYSVLSDAKALTGQVAITDLPEPQVDLLLSLHGKLRFLLEANSDAKLKSPQGDTATAEQIPPA
jgi:hypothetical protein